MAKAVLFVLTAALTAAGPVFAATDTNVRRESTGRRPDIVEVGEPYSISMTTVHNESAKISQLRTYLQEYGYPDYAEIQEIEPAWPWESYEVRLYYLRRNLELDFGHVFLSEAEPSFGVLKFQNYISPVKRHEIEIVLAAREAPPPAAPPEEEVRTGGLNEALVARIEAAAERAAQAADRATESSEAAQRAAERTVAVVDQLIQQTESH
jgi:hypothetical protein